MKKISSLFGLWGVLILIAGGIFYSIYQTLNMAITVLLAAGLPMLLFYFLINFPSLKGSLRTRSTKYGSNTALMIIVFLTIVVLLGAISIKRNKRFDLTEGRRYSLSSQSVKLLSSLTSEIKATGFFQDSSRGKTEANDLLRQYAYHSPLFKFQIIDPDRHPAKAKAHDITTYGTIVFESDKNREKVPITSEERFTNAILKVSREAKKIVYFLKGHGENDISNYEANGYSEAKKAITDQSYEVKDLTLFDKEKIPEDASLIVISGPRKDLFEIELKLLEEYLQSGGKLFILLDPDQGGGLVPFMAKYGISVGDNIIIDKVSKLFGGEYDIPVVLEYGNHPITKDFNLLTLFPIARSVEAMDDGPNHVVLQNLALTSSESWAEKDKERLEQGEAVYEDGEDIKGPVSLAAVATIEVTLSPQPSPHAWSNPPSSPLNIRGDRGGLPKEEGGDEKGNSYAIEAGSGSGDPSLPQGNTGSPDPILPDRGSAGSPDPEKGDSYANELKDDQVKTSKDPHGPYPEETSGNERKKARLVVFGDADFASNRYLTLSGNKDLFLNVISWLAEEENLISIRPKQSESAPALLSAAQGRIIFWFPVIIMPGAVLGVGALVIMRRRWRS